VDRPRRFTVGELRAELVGWPDEAMLVVHVPDRADPDTHAVLPVVAMGYGAGVVAGSDPVLAMTFPLVVAWRER
jgi:hypothetical protein